MKTLKIIGVLMFFGVFGLSSVHAQKNVNKVERILEIKGYLECTGEWIAGYNIIEDILSPHNWVTLIKKSVVLGYEDAACTIKTGNVYEISQVVPGSPTLDFQGKDGWFESTGKFTLDGKIVANFHEQLHMSTNANGDVTVDFWDWSMHCK